MSWLTNRLPRLSRGRFEVRKLLGAGGVGVVHEAYDHERGALVALKSLKMPSAEAIARLKREFRALEDLQHPNLVALDQLFEEDGEWFITMELVRGQDFISFVQGGVDQGTGVPFAESSLRSALSQLADALRTLHDAGKIHRDIKPSNVLVRADGHVVVLDFGLVAESERPGMWTSINAVGTALYMAPEQAAGRPVGPAADWYAVGAMLYEALTACPPFTGSAFDILLNKQRHLPAAPSTVFEALPPDLEALCMELLRIEPSRRPSGASVLLRLRGPEPAEPLQVGHQVIAGPSDAPPFISQQRSGLFVGRESELAFLDACLARLREGTGASVVLRGQSGIGKTALMRAFASHAEGLGAIVLSGRCHEREAVAYKAVDDVMEQLAELMRCMPEHVAATLVPAQAGVLTRVFPALQRVSLLARFRTQSQVSDPLELRALLFEAFREVFSRLCDGRLVVLMLDDLQWSDPEGRALLTELLRPPQAPPLLLIASFRHAAEGEAESVALESLLAHAHTLDIEPLHRDSAKKLASELLALAGADPARAVQVAEAGNGHPLFIDELARFTRGAENVQTMRLEDAIWARVQRLPPAERSMMEVYAMTAAPLSSNAAALASGLEQAQLLRHLAALRVQRLLRTTGDRDRELAEPYHDSVRRAVREHLADDRRRELHAALAKALRSTGHGDLEQLTLHYHAAGDTKHALHYALRAAENAEHALAFALAARLYTLVLELWTEDRPGREQYLIRLGDVLSNAGRGVEAARAYSEAAAHATDNARELHRRAAQQLLSAGHIDAGIGALKRVLDEEGLSLPRTSLRALFSVIAQRIWFKLRGFSFRAADANSVAPALRARADLAWRVALPMATVDLLRGRSLAGRAVFEALRTGDPYFVSRAISVYAGHLATEGRPTESEVDRILNLADHLTDGSNVHALAVTATARAQARFLAGRFRAAVAACDEAERLLRERCVGVHWELNTARLWRLRALVLMGEYAELRARLPAILDDCRQRNDLYGEVTLIASAHAMTLLSEDRPQDALDSIKLAASRWSPGGFHVQHYYLHMAHINVALYTGSFDEADELTQQLLENVERSLMKRTQLARVNTYFLCGRVAVALLQLRRDERRQLLSAERFVRKLQRERIPIAEAGAAFLQAAVSHRRGDRSAALSGLVRACEGFEVADMHLHVACMRRLLGRLQDEPGGALELQARTWFDSQHMPDPVRLLAMTAPGFE